MTSDLLFSAATVVTGDESAAPFEADVLISGSLITKIAAPGSLDAGSARRIDAKGHYLCPGFIDMHAHSDLYLLSNPEHEAKINQGCTVSFNSPALKTNRSNRECIYETTAGPERRKKQRLMSTD